MEVCKKGFVEATSNRQQVGEGMRESDLRLPEFVTAYLAPLSLDVKRNPTLVHKQWRELESASLSH